MRASIMNCHNKYRTGKNSYEQLFRFKVLFDPQAKLSS
ncbi:hypothetical protein NC99_06850 [Sunxiuqinia dokdonensis]|uniref:Uncharacterized protein n=1 Tax=Sunxiuqinia dokdonensis TaxID=1409788 RepID=A0A0L8VDL4_9BACT|nr:hypothetical protein NC99_06850 [Sunxiuqinia dokdonensis]